MATQKEVAEHLDLSTRRIQDLIKASILPGVKGHGGLDLNACRVAYIRHLRGIASGQVTNGEDIELSRERALLAKEQRRKLTRENDIEEGTVAPLALLTEALTNVAARVVPLLESLPLEMKRLNPKLTGHDIHTVWRAIARCRNAIADIKIETH